MSKSTEIKVKDESSKPIHWTLRAKALGAAGLMAGGAVVGVAATNHVNNSNRHNAIVRELEKDSNAVKADMKAGKINPADVTIVHASEGGYASDVAATISGPEHDSFEAQEIISAQTGGTNRVYPGEELVLPKGDVAGETEASARN